MYSVVRSPYSLTPFNIKLKSFNNFCYKLLRVRIYFIYLRCDNERCMALPQFLHLPLAKSLSERNGQTVFGKYYENI